MTEPDIHTVQVVKRGTSVQLALVDGDGTAVALVWPGMGAQHRTLHRFELGPAGRTLPQEHDGEAVYALLDGEATITDLSDGRSESLIVGAMVHLDPRTPYTFVAAQRGAVILGGPCPPDPTLYPSA